MRSEFAKERMVPKISVVVPVYNELRNIEKFLVRLTDALSQLETPFEVIFIDDFSSDGTFEYLTRFAKSEFIKVVRKEGKAGKAYSLNQGFSIAKGEVFAMIDGDLQYPPESLVDMIALLKKADIVIANRRHYKDSLLRKILNMGFRFGFGTFLFGLPYDIQSGLKVFKREVFDSVRSQPHSPWTFDLSFLHNAHQAGFTISQYDIVFYPRLNGESKVKF